MRTEQLLSFDSRLPLALQVIAGRFHNEVGTTIIELASLADNFKLRKVIHGRGKKILANQVMTVDLLNMMW